MSTRTLMKAEEFESICDQFGPCELVRGEVMRLSPGGYLHSRVSVKIAFVLEKWASETNLGRVIGNEAGIVVESEPDTVRGAEAAYFSYQRLPKGAEPVGFCTTPPELVVEVIGKGQGWREMVEKAGEYLRFGVDRVWVVDPKSRRVHILRGDVEPSVVSEGQTLADETILPGFYCTVDEFFED